MKESIDLGPDSKVLRQLSERFDPTEVKERRGRGGISLKYIDIATTIRRLNEVLGMQWSFRIDGYELKIHPEKTDKGATQYLAVVSGELSIRSGSGEDFSYVSHAGIGASILGDPDDAVKTALAEAIKKAGHQLGIGLFLWDEDERDFIDLYHAATTSNDIALLKTTVQKIAIREGADELDAQGIATHFGVPISELNNPDTLKEIIERHK